MNAPEPWLLLLILPAILLVFVIFRGLWLLHLRASMSAHQARDKRLTLELMLLERELFYYSKLKEELSRG